MVTLLATEASAECTRTFSSASSKAITTPMDVGGMLVTRLNNWLRGLW
jgi:hypothetical protein